MKRETKRERLCLQCEGSFSSEGKWNRLCKKCRNTTAITPDEYGGPVGTGQARSAPKKTQ